MQFNEYETIYVTRPDLPEAELSRIRTRLEGILTDGSASVLEVDEWGRRKLAYLIKKHTHGHYVYVNYLAPAELPLELERIMRIEDNLIRFLTVRLGEDVDAEEARVEAEERIKAKAARRALDEDDDGDDDGDDRRRRRPAPPAKAAKDDKDDGDDDDSDSNDDDDDDNDDDNADDDGGSK